MAITDSNVYVEVETTLGGKGGDKNTAKLPDATASATAFRALTGMATSGQLRISIAGEKLVIPLLHDS